MTAEAPTAESANIAAKITLLVPVTAIALGYVLLGEVVTPREIVGALIIASGLLIMDGRLLSRFATPQASR